MDLVSLTDTSWNIQPSNALTGEGVDIGLNWVT